MVRFRSIEVKRDSDRSFDSDNSLMSLYGRSKEIDFLPPNEIS